MPRRGSRAHLIHLLADMEAFVHREVYGDRRVRPHDFYADFQRISTAELQGLAAGLTPGRRGRPKGGGRGSSYTLLFARVDDVRARRKLSTRAACRVVASKAGASEHYLRKRYLTRRRSVRI